MEIILREDIDNLGTRGQVVKVAPGYARNFLLPKRLAVAATEANKKIVEQERQAHLRKEAKLKSEAEDLAKLLAGVTSPSRRRPARTISCSARSRRKISPTLWPRRTTPSTAGRSNSTSRSSTRRVQGPRAPAQGSDRGYNSNGSPRRVVREADAADALVPPVFAYRIRDGQRGPQRSAARRSML